MHVLLMANAITSDHRSELVVKPIDRLLAIFAGSDLLQYEILRVEKVEYHVHCIAGKQSDGRIRKDDQRRHLRSSFPHHSP